MLRNLKLTNNKKNVIKISSGTILGQIISIITLPIIARLYGAEIIGVWTLVNSIAVIVNSFSDFGLTNTLMTEKEEKNNYKTYKIITTIVALISIVSGIVLVIFMLLNSKSSGGVILLAFFLMFIIFTSQQIQVCYTWLNRNNEYGVLMKNPVINNSVYGAIAIILGLLGFTIYGYFIGHIIGRIVTLLHMKRKLPRGLFTFNISDIKDCIKRNNNFIKFQMPSNFIYILTTQLPILLIGRLWGSEILGYYSITINLLQIPINFLANAIGRVFFQTISDMKREGKNISKYVMRNLNMGMRAAILPMGILMAYGDILSIIFLGNEWKVTGDFIRIMAIQSFFMFLMTTVRGTALTLDKQKYSLFSNIGQFLFYIIGAVIGKYVFDNIYIAIALMALFYVLTQIIYFTALFKFMKAPIRVYITNVIISIIMIAGISIIMRWLAKYLGVIDLVVK